MLGTVVRRTRRRGSPCVGRAPCRSPPGRALRRAALVRRKRASDRRNGLALAEWTVSLCPAARPSEHCFSSCSAIPRLPNCFASSFAASSSSIGISVRKHLDDRHLAAEALEDRGELAADDAAAEDDEPPRDLLCASSPVESTHRSESRPWIGGGAGRSRSRRWRCRKVTSSPPSTAIVFALLNRPRAPDPLHPVRLEQARDPACHLLHHPSSTRSPGRSRARPRRR